MSAHPLIDALDLRPPQPGPEDFVWDFPKFPAKVTHFINGGRYPKWKERSIKVHIIADTSEFNASMQRIQLALAHAAKQGISVSVMDHLYGNIRTVAAGPEWARDLRDWQCKWFPRKRRYNPMREWNWLRIVFAAGVLAAFATCVYLEAWAWF